MSKERFKWLKKLGAEVYATPGCESNVKEIYDKSKELCAARPDEVVNLNQFSEIGNPLWHYAVTGPAMEEVFNDSELLYGNMVRDFTYVADIVEGVIRVIDHPPAGNPGWNGADPDPSSSRAPYKIYNIGNNNPVKLMDFIAAIEKRLGKEAVKEMLPMQPGDVPATSADVADLVRDLDYKPETGVKEGIDGFLDWYLGYF